MADLAELEIRVRASEVGIADSALAAMTASSIGADKSTAKLTTTFKGLAQSIVPNIGHLGQLKTLLIAIGGLTLARSIISATSAYEQMRLALTATIGSAGQAEVVFTRLQQLTKEVPGNIDELTGAFIRLKNVGVDPTNDVLKSLSNIAAAQRVPLEQVVDAVGRAAIGQARGLAQFNIRAEDEAGKIKITFKGLSQVVSRDANEIVNAIAQIGATQFAGAATGQVQSIAEAFDDLREALKEFYAAIGETPVKALVAVLHALTSALKFLSANTEVATGLIAAFGTALLLVSLKAIPGLIASISKLAGSMLGLNLAIKASPIVRLAILVGTAVTSFGLLHDKIVSIGGISATVGQQIVGTWKWVAANITDAISMISGGTYVPTLPSRSHYVEMEKLIAEADKVRSMGGGGQDNSAALAAQRAADFAKGLVPLQQQQELTQAILQNDHKRILALRTQAAIQDQITKMSSELNRFLTDDEVRNVTSMVTELERLKFAQEDVQGLGAHQQLLSQLGTELEIREELVAMTDAQAERFQKVMEFQNAAKGFFGGMGTPEAVRPAVDNYRQELIRLDALAAQKKIAVLHEEIGLEKTLVGLTQQQAQIEAAVAEFRKMAVEAYPDDLNARAAAVSRYATALREVQQAQAQHDLSLMFNDLRNERLMVNLTNEERERSIRMLEVQKVAEAAYGVESARTIAILKLYERQLQELHKAQQLREMADRMAASIGDAFESIVFGAQSAKQAVAELAEELAKMAFRQFVTTPFQNWMAGGLGGLFGAGGPAVPSALGNIFDQGKVKKFASGGIISGPTYFPLGLAGERGMEGIFPVKRMPGGELGIRGDGGGNRTTIVNMKIVTPDVGGFRRSERQTASQIKRMFDTGVN